MIDFTKITLREENTEIPQGISLTQTSIANYIRIRSGNKKVLVYVPLDENNSITVEYSECE